MVRPQALSDEHVTFLIGVSSEYLLKSGLRNETQFFSLRAGYMLCSEPQANLQFTSFRLCRSHIKATHFGSKYFSGLSTMYLPDASRKCWTR